LINCTQKHVLRIMPPLTVKKGQAARAIKILDKVLKEVL
jgi:4-aminobutyrate aminotransferase-like enzyme